MTLQGTILFVKLPEYTLITESVIDVFVGPARHVFQRLCKEMTIVCLGADHFNTMWDTLGLEGRFIHEELDKHNIENLVYHFEKKLGLV